MSDPRVLQLVKDYMQTIRAAAGNDEFLEGLADLCARDSRPLAVLSQMNVGELHERFASWITEHDE